MTGSEHASERDVYTHGHHDSVLRSHRWRTARNSAAYLAPLLKPEMTLLDVGCGPGTLTADLAALVAPGRVVGVDVAAEVVEQARAHGSELGADNLTFVCDDFRTMSSRTEPFDVVHAHQVLQHLRDPVGALRELARLARPGGLVAVRDSDYSAMTWAPADPRLDRWLSIYLDVTRHNGAEAEAGRHLLAWARAAGISDVTYTSSTWTFATPDDRTWWGELWAERVVSSALAEQAVRYDVAGVDELADIATAWRTWAAAPDAVFIVVHGELVARV